MAVRQASLDRKDLSTLIKRNRAHTRPQPPPSGGAGPGGFQVWGPPWLVLSAIIAMVFMTCVTLVCMYALIASGQGADLALVLWALRQGI